MLKDCFSALKELDKLGMKFGTRRTRELLNALGSPDKHLKTVHIAGTNGKGSVAEYMSRILIAAQKKVGTFTSPAVFDFAEQVKINGKNLSDEKLSRYIDEAAEAANFKATSFEVLTCAAILAFFKEGCEYAVIECGMGGRDDATNAISKKELALITSIGLEHTKYLGGTIESICAHKAGIIKNCPAAASALQPPEALAFFKKNGIYVVDKPQNIASNSDGQTFLYGGEQYKIKMFGYVQPYNAALAIEGARRLNIDEAHIKEGLENSFIGGRIEYIKKSDCEYILDGGHNPSGIEPLARFVKERFKGGATLIFGCLSDKDIDGNLRLLSDKFERAVMVIPDSPRAMDGDKMFAALKKFFKITERAESVTAALENAKGQVAVSGSFTLMKEAHEWIEKRS